MSDPVREGIQQVCDNEGSGWQVNHYVIAAGLERMGVDGFVETAVWAVAQNGQPEYVTDGLLSAAISVRMETADDE